MKLVKNYIYIIINNNLQKISTNEANYKLKNVKPVSQLTNFINYLNKLYVEVENNNNSYGSSVGGASRGIKNEFNPKQRSVSQEKEETSNNKGCFDL